MSKVVAFKRPSLKQKAKGRTLCNSGFHKWRIDKERRFDVKAGKLVTTRRCERCGIERISLD